MSIVPVYDADEDKICFDVSWMNPADGADFHFTNLTRFVAGEGTVYIFGRASFGYDGEQLGVPYSTPMAVRDCPPSGVDVNYSLRRKARPSKLLEEIVRVPGPPEAPGMVTYSPPPALDQAGALTWGELDTFAKRGYVDNITGYEVQYRIGGRTHWHAVEHSGLEREYEDGQIWKQGTTLHFRVRATNLATQHFPHLPGTWGTVTAVRIGTAPMVSELTITPSELADGAATFFPISNLQLAWVAATGNVAGQLIYRRVLGESVTPWELIATDVAAGVTAHQVPAPLDSGYEYAVQAFNLNGGGELSRATFQIVPPPPDVLAPMVARAEAHGVAGGTVAIEGPVELVAGRVHEFTVTATAPAGSAVVYRYGGDRRGVAFDVGPNRMARWVNPDNRAACVDVVLCAFRSESIDRSYYPSDGRPSRWLVVWKGSDSTDGFATGDEVQVYVPPTVVATTTVNYGLAQLRSDEVVPVWIGSETSSAEGETLPHRSLTVRGALPSAANFMARTEGAGQVRLEWVPAGGSSTLQQLQRKLSTADETSWARVCCNLPAEQSWIVDTPPMNGSTVSYDYRVGTYTPAGLVQWFGPTITVVLTGGQVGAPTTDSLPRFATADQDTAISSITDVTMADEPLPTVTGGDGIITYTVSDLSTLGLRLEVISGIPRLRPSATADSAVSGALQGTLQAEDEDGDVDFLLFRVRVGHALGPPRNLAASAAGQHVTLTWEPPMDSNEYAVTGYRVERLATSDGTDWIARVPLTATAETSFEDRGLSGATTWSYRVAAVDALGIGQFATVAVATAPSTPPDPPTGLVATPGLQHVDLTWEAPVANGGSTVTAYVVEYSWTGVSDSWQSVGEEPTITSYTHGSLWPNWAVHYRVRARNSVGLSVVSAPTFAVTASDGAVPTNLTATAGIRHIRIDWTAPPGAGPDVRYRIEQSATGADGSWRDLEVDTGNAATSYTHAGLAPNETVHYRVATVHRGGVGVASAPDHATALTGERVPFAPTDLDSVPYHGRIELSWTAPEVDGGAPIDGYRIEISDTGRADDWDELEADTGSATASYSHTGLNPDERIFHRVAAINSAGAGDWSNELESVVLGVQPGAPRILGAGGITAVADGGITELEISFAGPGHSSGGTVSNYLVQIGASPRYDLVPKNFRTVLLVRNRWGLGVNVIQHRFKIDPPTPRRDTIVFVRLIGRNAAGAGPPSNAEPHYFDGVSTAVRALPEPPSTPRNLTADIGAGQLGLRWEPPADDGGGAIGGYQIEQWSDDLEMWVDAVTNTESDITAHVFRRIPPKATFRYRVSAINSAGTSDPSALVRVDSANVTVPASPNQLTTTVAAGTITLSWLAPTYDGGARITGYRIEHSTNGAPGTWQVLSHELAASTRRAHVGLSAGQRVHYRVFASNRVGDSLPTATVAAQLPAALPTAPTSLTAIAGQTRVFLDWVPPAAVGGDTVEGYRIQRRISGVATWETVVPHTGTVRTRHVDAGRAAGVALDYRVSAITSAGPGAGVEVSATPEANRPEPPSNVVVTVGASGLDVDWDAPATAGTGAAISGYRIERSSDLEANWTAAAADTASTVTHFSDTAANAGERPIYRVIAINDQTHTSIPAGFVTATGARPPPTPINVLVASEWNQHTITWLAVPADHSPAPTGYRIVSADSADAATWQFLVDVGATSSQYTHEEVGNLRTVYYRVATRSAVGASRFSAPSGATTLDPEVALDINGVSGFDENDALILYYALNFPELVGGGRGEPGFASIRRAMLSGLVGQLTYEDSVALQLLDDARQLARDYAETTVDVNGDRLVDASDALVMYYAYRLSATLGDGNSGGTPALRRTFLSGLATTPNLTDSDLQDMLERANQLNLK